MIALSLACLCFQVPLAPPAPPPLVYPVVGSFAPILVPSFHLYPQAPHAYQAN